MPPHCDSLDGPVVSAARQALDEGDVDIVLPFVPADGEALTHELNERLAAVGAYALEKEASTAAARRYVEAALGFQVYSHHLLKAIHAPAHESP